MSMKENKLITNKHILVYTKILSENAEKIHIIDFENIKKKFCGLVVSELDELNVKHKSDTIIFMAGDIGQIYENIKDKQKNIFCIIRELSYNYVESDEHEVLNIGEIPININNVGVYFQSFFDKKKDYFDLISTEHSFQDLTESNKPGKALRNGIYLTEVTQQDENELLYKLLRCSTNLTGPTDNFRKTDHEIIDKVNNIGKFFFKSTVKFNHVLAQIYNNVNGKAQIKSHSDKTKDMPKNGLMAFCTFYKDYHDNKFNDNNLKLIKKLTDKNCDIYDHYYKTTTSILTRLRFRLKGMVEGDYVKYFDITLYPNSVFLMSLDMNRMYTHEIVPSILPMDKIPTRMGYVIRCSKTECIFNETENKTFIIEGDKNVQLRKPVDDEIKKLKEMYFRENMTDELMEYGDVHFSLNNGDYMKPIL